MREDPKKSNGKPKKPNTTVILGCIAGALLLVVLIMVLVISLGTEEPEPTEPTETTTVTEPTETQVETTVPAETEPQILENLRDLYAQNQDLAGWLRIDETVIDYPVMHTPDDEEKYLRADIDGNYSTAGMLFIDADCSMEPESDNLIIYGHNMSNGTMFKTLMSYRQKSFWEEHPKIYFSTLYEERTYEVVAAFYDRVYYKYENVFKFYQFTDAEDEEDFGNAMAQYKKKALYETGVTAEYGDKLLTLVTCSYHTKNGRFVVVARAVNEPEVLPAETAASTTP